MRAACAPVVTAMTRRTLLFVLGFAAAPSAAVAQGVAAAELRAVLDRLASVATSFEGPRLRTAVRWLQNNGPRADLRRLTREYIRSLERAATLLERRPLPPVVEDVTVELERKVSHCQTLGVGMGGTVALAVHTKRAGAAVPQWQVQYLLKFDEWLKTPPRTFPRVSTPTDARVEPGRYWIWARDPVNGRTSDRVLVDIAGVTSLNVDVTLP